MNAEVLQSQTVYQGHAFSVRKDRVRLAAGQVSVKAKSTDHIGALGRGEGIAALATVLLEKGS